MKLTDEQIKGNPLRVTVGGMPVEDQGAGIREFMRQSAKAPSKDEALPTGIDATLAARGNRYGKFVDHAEVTQVLKRAYTEHAAKQDVLLDDDMTEALDMICHKIGRIVNGDPHYADSWVDIAGYAKLVADRLEGIER